MRIFLILTVIISVLVILRLAVIPNLGTDVASSSCAFTTLSNLIDNSELIIIGTAINERVETASFFERGTLFTYTTIGDIDAVKGDLLSGTNLKAKQIGGCDTFTGYCLYTSIMSPFKIGEKYLLFLRPAMKYRPSPAEPPPSSFGRNVTKELDEVEEGVYSGFSGCGGKYLLSETTSYTEIKEIISSGDEAGWRTFLGTLPREKTQDGVSPQSIGSPGTER